MGRDDSRCLASDGATSREDRLFTTAPTTMWAYPQPSSVMLWYRTGATTRTPIGKFCHWTPIMVYGDYGTFWTDTISLPAAGYTPSDKPDHPDPKPEKLLTWLIENSSNPGDIIFDPLCGSGTTGVAALKLGRRFICIELNPAFVDIARERLTAAPTHEAPDSTIGPMTCSGLQRRV